MEEKNGFIKTDTELNYAINTIKQCIEFSKNFDIKNQKQLIGIMGSKKNFISPQQLQKNISQEKNKLENEQEEKKQQEIEQLKNEQENKQRLSDNLSEQKLQDKGIVWIKERKIWRSSLIYNKKSRHLGYFDNTLDAKKVYNDYAVYLNQTFNCNYILHDIQDYTVIPRNVPEENKATTKRIKTSKYTGVSYIATRNNYSASISVNKKTMSIMTGLKTELEAAKAYNQQALFYNNTKKAKYILNDIPGYITEARDIKSEKIGIKATNKSSKYVGVMWHKSLSTWKALLRYNNNTIYLGSFDKEIDAAKAYNQQALYLNNENKTSYKLNTIENYTTEPRNFYGEKYNEMISRVK